MNKELNEYKKLKNFLSLSTKKILRYFYSISLDKLGDKNILCFFLNRLDIILFLSKSVNSLSEARQLILHNKVLINNKIVNLKSVDLKVNDVISLSMNTSIIRRKNFIVFNECPNWIKVIIKNNLIKEIILIRLPNKNDSDVILKLNDILIVDFLSKKYGIK